MSDACSLPEWLPDLVPFNGVWSEYVELLYSYFKGDFLMGRTMVEGKPLAIRRHPVVKGKEGMFWHLIGHEDGQELPETFSRAAHIRWPKQIILHRGDKMVKLWRHSNFKASGENRSRMCIWYNDEYLVVLEPRQKYVSLVTAYPTDMDHTRRKLQSSYEKAKKQGSPELKQTTPDTPSTHGR